MINRNYFRHLKGIQIFNVCTNYRKNLYFQESWFKNFKFFSFYSSFRKTKFFPSSSFFKAFTNASHKNFLKTSRKLFSQCLVRIRFLASSKKYNVVGMYILEREDPRNPLALESEEFVSMRSRFLFKLTKSNLQSRLFTTACNFAFPHFICDVTPTLYLI